MDLADWLAIVCLLQGIIILVAISWSIHMSARSDAATAALQALTAAINAALPVLQSAGETVADQAALDTLTAGVNTAAATLTAATNPTTP